MTLILHIVAKDIAMLRNRLAVWLAVLAIKTAAGIYLVGSANLAGVDFGALQGALLTLSVTDVALTFLLAGLLVHADGLMGAEAAWMTRPIAGWRLLRAKMVVALAAFVVPAVLLALPWWWYCGFGAGELWRAVVELAVVQTAIVLPVMAIASVTRTLPQMAIGTVVAMAGVFTVMSARGGVMTFFGAGYGARMLVFGGLILALASVFLPWHYVRRRGNRALVVFGGGVMMAAAGGSIGEDVVGLFGHLREATRQREPKVMGAPGVKVAWASAHARSRSRASEPSSLEIRYRLDGVPGDVFVGSGQAWHEWTAGEGALFVERSRVAGMVGAGFVARERAMGAQVNPEMMGLQANVALGPERVRELGRRTNYRGVLKFPLVRARVTEAPLREGEWRSDHGRGLRVTRVQTGGLRTEGPGSLGPRERRRFAVHVLETAPSSLLDDLRRGETAATLFGGDTARYVLRNATGTFSDAQGGQPQPGFVLTGVAVRPRVLSFAGPILEPGQPALPDPGETLRLSVVSFRDEETVVREVRTEEFILAN